ncbi:hypothetical protein [Vitiosangium sp. GDMCC 1.1324]|uniref:hypothetical protein n=1 Tax=Vitiosangium sp. (strain GDMCC 1.1324) TaxID=2138576 RepID=UPI000D3AFC2F|nr:hypothetical protein [Vitiosangium sp. GDMCC 1.1324]PTL77429.1 hypothetical protein DAT35_44295 [Vitiosangium sp. GDMCC 1.1324]
MTALRIRPLLLVCLMLLPVTAGATDVRFEQGSLIIPMQKAYQTQCGATSAYGLVYRLLQQGVTVYWAVQPNKTSHHRCKTKVDSPAVYIDGCDFEVAKASGRPVSLLENARGTFKDDFDTFDTSSNPNGTGEGAFKVDRNQARLRYMGGPFLIDATDAAKAVDLLKNHADFALFRGSEGGVDCAPGSNFNVRVHRVNNAFVAPIARIMNEVPPPIALVRGRNTSNAGSVEILREYLKNAGLNFAGAEGTFESHGKIFDVLDQDRDLISTASFPKGKINYAPNASTPNKTYYKVLWSPHWEGDRSQQANLKAALANISHFVDLGNSIFNECASIATYEDSFKADDSSRELYDDNDPTQFMSTTDNNPGVGLQTMTTNQLVGESGFAPNGQDCSDPGVRGDCYIFRNYADLFSQKGDYPFSLTFGAVEGFRPRRSKNYGTGTVQMISTKSGTAAKDGWDIYISRPKDNNRQKGNVLYLAGHSFSAATAGNRIVLNTLLNLAFKPESLETSRSEPVADVTYKADGSVNQVHVLSGTYLHTPPQALFPERINFRADKAADWVFPYIEGRFRSLLADNIDTNRQGFSKNAEWEASERVPAPGSRNIFTVLGSNQEGLKRVSFNLAQLGSSCLDTETTGKIEGMCDLQEALTLDRNSAGVSVVDLDGNGKIDPSVPASKLTELNHTSQHFLQRVRGYCVAHDTTDSNRTDTMTPTISDCDNRQFGEVRATLGGLDHASAAVVGASQYIKVTRPEMIYIGGLDGQLHALYLRGSGVNFTPPAQGTEVWAFIPKGQLSRLLTNNARVDVSPVVSDVYVDYEDKNADGVLSPDERNTGIFRWRTVLVSGSGRLGGEIFALDVTNPLKPIVLWDVTASVDHMDDPVAVNNTAFLWSDKAGGPTPNYKELSSATLTGPYNYTDLGDSLDMNLVPVRRGNRPTFQLIVSTNGARTGAQQMQVFALDAGTGKKLWQWERPYGATTSNSVPGGTSTLDVDGDGSMDRVYVGDMEGRLWELSIHTGVNLNYFDSVTTGSGSYPLFTTNNAQHPISTVPAIMRLPYSLAGGMFSSLGVGNAAAGKLALVFGTGGPDWVLAVNPTIKGRVYVVASNPEDLRIRDQLSYDKQTQVSSSLDAQMGLRGTTKPGAALYLELAEKERAVGSPKLVGSKIVLTSAYGTTESDPFSSDMQGRTHVLDLSQATADKVVGESGKAAAGGLVLPDGTIITQSMVGLQRTPPAALGGAVPTTGLGGKRTPARVGSWLDLGRALSE